MRIPEQYDPRASSPPVGPDEALALIRKALEIVGVELEPATAGVARVLFTTALPALTRVLAFQTLLCDLGVEHESEMVGADPWRVASVEVPDGTVLICAVVTAADQEGLVAFARRLQPEDAA